MPRSDILVEGAREHNLKNITVRIPRNSLCVVTGLSGSGKSSLAFDTLYAEGQRKYVESLSSYARMFLEQLQKPEVDRIEGLSPAIAIEQRTAGANPRSIVATTTEIHDYLRLLYASVGRQHCHLCGKPITRQSAEEIVNRILQRPQGTKVQLLAPLVDGRKGEHIEVFESARRQGFTRVLVNGEMAELESPPKLDKQRKHSIAVVVDRLVVNGTVRGRLTDSVELSLKQGKGVLTALFQEKGREDWTPQLFSEKNACASCGVSFEELRARNFSFNSPYGACSRCDGIGQMLIFDEDLVVPDPEKSLDNGAIAGWRPSGRREAIYRKRLLRSLAAHYGFDLSTPWKDLPARIRRIVLEGSGDEEIELGLWRGGAYRKYMKPFEGVIPNLNRRYTETDSDYIKKKLAGFMSRLPCTACEGKRLKPESLACRVGGRNIMEIMALSATDAAKWFEKLSLTEQEQGIAAEVLKEIRKRLHFLCDVGLGYLSLARESGTLSGGEAQRIRLATQVGAGLVGVLYVLDEPSIGLHQRDNEKLLRTLKGLRDLGNTVVVVEHDEQTIRAADYVIDLGPAAGVHGGEVVYSGPAEGLTKAANSLTAKFLNGTLTIAVPGERQPAAEPWLTIRGAAENNLKNIDVRFPLGRFSCVTGVSGSGKSTLVDDILRRALFRKFYGSKDKPGKHRQVLGTQRLDKVVVIDQSPIGRTPRSNPATYTGAFTAIRNLFAELPTAKVRGYGPGRFSFNVKGGRCETCKGDGILKIEMNFLPDVYVTCEQCRGRRYNRETLEVTWRGKNIADVLGMTVDEALSFFSAVPAIARKFKTMSDVGLGYLKVGQPATTLSGGEAQRMKLSAELSRRDTGRTLYLLDEPTTGLHFADVDRLLQVLLRLRDAGNTLIVIEHNLDVIKTADYIVDLGPGGGDEGGHVVACGTPEEVAANPKSDTGAFLKPLLKVGAKPKPRARRRTAGKKE